MKTKSYRFAEMFLRHKTSLSGLICAAVVALAPDAWAVAWTSTATGGSWTAATTWTALSGSPAAGDTVTIATTVASSVTLPGTTTIAGIIINSGATLNIGSGSTVQILNLNGNLVNNGTITASTSTSASTLNIGANCVYSGSSGVLAVNGSGGKVNIAVLAGFTFTLNQSIVQTSGSRSLTLTGTSGLTFDASSQYSVGTLVVVAGSLITTANPNGLGTAAAGSTGSLGAVAAMGTFTGNGLNNYTFNGSGAQSSGSVMPTTCTGTVTIQNGAAFTVSSATGFIMNTPGVLAVNSPATLAFTSAQTVTGTGTLNGTGTIQVTKTGSATTDDGTQYAPTTKTLSSLTVEFNGAAAQKTITPSFGGLKVNNSAGLTLGANAAVSGALTLTSGKVGFSAGDTITLGTSATESATTGWVNGKIAKSFTSAAAHTFFVGTASQASQCAVASFTATGAGTLTANATTGAQPNLGTSDISATKYINRYWTITSTVFTGISYNFTGTFVAGDVLGGANTASLVIRKYNAGWLSPSSSSSTSTTATGNGFTSFSDFAAGEVGCTPPTATVSGGGTICQGQQSVNVSVALTGVSPWSVTYSDGAVSNGVSSSPLVRSVSPSSTTTYTVTAVSDSSGCSGGTSPGSAVVTVTTPVTPSVSIGSDHGTSTCSSSTIIFTATPVNGGSPTYVWKTNSVVVTGVTGNTLTVAGSALNTGANSVDCRLTSTATCVTSSTADAPTFTMTISGSVTPSVTVASNPGTNICVGKTVIFTATPVNGGGSPTYIWKTNSVQDTSVPAGSATYTNSTLVNGETIDCRLTSSDACASPTTANATQITMIVNALNTPSLTVTANQTFPVCAGTPVIFTATPVNGGASPSYQWKLNSGNVGVNSATYTNSSLANNDLVAAILTPSADICPSVSTATNSVTATVTANVTPSVTLAASPGTTNCVGTQVIFTATPVSGGSPTYAWKTNGVQDTSVPASSATYTNSTLADGATVSVTMTSTVACVTSPTANSSTLTMKVNSFGIGGGSATLINENFTAQTGWTLGTGWSVIATTPLSYSGGSGGNYANFTPGTAGNYLTSPTVNATGDSSLQLSFAALRSSGLTGNLLVEASADNGSTWSTVTTIASSSIVATVGAVHGPFSLGAGFDNHSQVIVRFSMTSPGGSTPRLRVDDVSLTATAAPAATNATITATPGNATVCAPSTVGLAAAAGGSGYAWSGPSGFTASTANITATSTGNYTVTITDAHGCSSTTNQTVTINAQPSGTVTVSTNAACSGTAGLTASVANAGAGASYTWSVSNGTIDLGNGTNSISFTVTNTSGTAVVSVGVTNSSGCGTTSTSNVTINPIPSSTITAPSAVCPSSSGNLASVPSVGGANYSWGITGGTIDSGNGTASISFTAVASGTVQLTCTVTSAAGCASAQGSANIPIGSPSSTITASSVCGNSAGNIAAVPDAGVGATYAWSIGNGTITAGATSRQLTFTAGASGTVLLTNTVTSAAGCSSTGNASVSINPLPNTTITASSSVCANSTGNIASITDAGAGSHYGWTISGGSITAGANTNSITYTATNSGSILLACSVTNANGCVSNSATTSVTINPLPSATITKSATAACAGTSGLTASVPDAGVGSGYGWSISNGTIDSGNGTASISFTLGSSGTTTLNVAVTNGNGCVSNGTASVTVNSFGIGGGSSTIMTQDFTAQGAWTLGTGWTLTTTTPLTNSSGVGQGQYANFTPGTAGNYLISPSGDASGDTSLQLSFFSTRSTGYAGDLLVEASTNGGTSWTTVTNIVNTNIVQSAVLGPVQGPISLGTAFDNKSAVQVRFSAAGSMAGSNPRLRIDNVSLTGTAAPAATNATITATPGNATVCAPSTVGLAAAAGGSSYAWSGPSGFTASTANITATSTGNYTVTITDAHGCTSTTNQTVTIKTVATVNAGANQTVPASTSTVQLAGTIGGGASGDQWTTGGTGSFDDSTLTNAAYTPSQQDKTNRQVSLTLTTTGANQCAPVNSAMTITFNSAPTASNITMGVVIGIPSTMQIIGGKHAPSDPDNDTLTITSVTGATNGIVTFTGTNITCTATNGTADSFTYIVSDGFGGSASATINVAIIVAGQGFNQLSLVILGNGDVKLTFLGVPGYTYALDWTHELSQPINWTPVLTNTAASNGYLLFTNTPSGGSDFFRTRYAP